ncbi:hypothetical protein F5148DRAFT_1298873 [Russula earlei]|uniref:Uncharacterized protein n=1 Tax=Russula earlei TaxID=71964 RepID=A0ACC0UCN9_9AGAM|nr:hypothetical protein F5148DRAFT_1298873 [Russula earlei]
MYSPTYHSEVSTSTIALSSTHDISDPSIDAVDLADYTRTLDPTYDGYRHGYPLPPPPRSVSITSHASLNPPSLVSSRGTPTSQSHSPSSRHTNHRAFFPSVPLSSLTQPSYVHPTSCTIPSTSLPRAEFPPWSRGWYTKDNKSPKTEAQSEASRAPFFDPSYQASAFAGNNSLYPATNSASSREFVPWSSNDTPHYDFPLDPELKEERIRMLEHEFRSGLDAPAKEEPVGSVDQNGRLITEGPKKRAAVRAIETVLALGIATSVLYAALWIKTPYPPPPQSKPHTFALYALSVLTSLFFIYRFLFRPCCCGLAVLPVQGLSGDTKKKRKGKKEQESVQVNLIVDPTIFRTTSSSISQTGTNRRPKRRSVFEGLAIEEQWRAARKELKWKLFLDASCFFLWSVEFIWILIRERCPPGGFNGWCNAYNVATTGTCLLALVFGLNVFFDVKDLHQSRVSPRTRT